MDTVEAAVLDIYEESLVPLFCKARAALHTMPPKRLHLKRASLSSSQSSSSEAADLEKQHGLLSATDDEASPGVKQKFWDRVRRSRERKRRRLCRKCPDDQTYRIHLCRKWRLSRIFLRLTSLCLAFVAGLTVASYVLPMSIVHKTLIDLQISICSSLRTLERLRCLRSCL